MPLPTPRDDEAQDEFVSRCMRNDESRRDFPERDQRLAVCFDLWRRRRENDDDE